MLEIDVIASKDTLAAHIIASRVWAMSRVETRRRGLELLSAMRVLHHAAAWQSVHSPQLPHLQRKQQASESAPVQAASVCGAGCPRHFELTPPVSEIEGLYEGPGSEKGEHLDDVNVKLAIGV